MGVVGGGKADGWVEKLVREREFEGGLMQERERVYGGVDDGIDGVTLRGD